jgi:EipB-like
MTAHQSRYLRRCATAALLAAVTALPARAADLPGLSPHRAVYEITLDKAKTGAGVADLSGRMVYELTGNACTGFTQTMRFVTRMTSAEGDATLNDLRSSTYEDLAATTFKFSSSQYRDDQQAEATSGDAKREQGSGDIKVEVKTPKKAALTVAANTLFPVQHSIAMLAAARAGQSIFAADLYDGSEKGEKVYATTAVIGARLAPGKTPKLPVVKNAEPLADMASWPISLSYFDKSSDKSDSGPAYELAFLFFENGVSQRLFIDYGDFSIRGALKDLTFLDSPPCDKKP